MAVHTNQQAIDTVGSHEYTYDNSGARCPGRRRALSGVGVVNQESAAEARPPMCRQSAQFPVSQGAESGVDSHSSVPACKNGPYWRTRIW